MTAAPALALVLPCFNPLPGWANNILESLSRLYTLLPPDTLIHLYLVNDGSTRNVDPAEVMLLEQEVPHFTYLTYSANRGKGYALRMGVEHVQEPICLFTDIDFPYEERSIASLYATLRAGGCDLAVGVRDEAYYQHVPATRRRISHLLRGLTRNLLHLPVSDTQCGLKGFNATGRAVFLQTTTDRYLFDLEFLFLASRQPHVRVEPVLVSLKPGVVFSKLNSRILLTEGASFLKILRRRML
ncbi:glycosyltransferase family 2 protein [Hymenobacter crusticola]|nr:glycosyltransferase family 2 protein [Hymenobacter crusticola]